MRIALALHSCFWQSLSSQVRCARDLRVALLTYGRLGIVHRARFPAQEVTIQLCTSGDTFVEEAECSGVRDSKWAINRAEAFIDAGAHVRLPSRSLPLGEDRLTHTQMTMIESERITGDVKPLACKHAQPLHNDRVCVTPSTVFTC